jgi:RNA polymerase sigma factor (sigma-70 family)
MPIELTIAQQNQSIADAMERDEPRLRNFIRNRVLDSNDVEDILQDVFYELIQAYRLLKPAEQVTAWLYRVARNRIIDLFRRRKITSLDQPIEDQDETRTLADLLPSPDAGPDAHFAHNLLLEAFEDALDELPANQRDVFLAHEFEEKSFKEIAAETGVSVNTLLSRKRYAVLHLRKRLLPVQQFNKEQP